MEKEFVPYEIALALKELGFDEPCFASYVKESKEFTTRGFADFYKEQQIYAPLYQQAFRWFREKYGIKNYVYEVLEERFVFVTYTNPLDYKMSSTYHTTYEEAELECLKKLIKIVKEKQL